MFTRHPPVPVQTGNGLPSALNPLDTLDLADEVAPCPLNRPATQNMNRIERRVNFIWLLNPSAVICYLFRFSLKIRIYHKTIDLIIFSEIAPDSSVSSSKMGI